jgi:uncharacterized protein
MPSPTSYLGQRTRLSIVGVEMLLLCAASWLATGAFVPSSSNQGYWFYAALLGLVLSRRLDTPFYPTPADVVLYAAPAAVTLQLVNGWEVWGPGEKVSFSLALTYCMVATMLGSFAIATKDAASERLRALSDSARMLLETIGTARAIYSVVLAFAVYTFHRSSARELGVIVSVWVLVAFLSPVDETLMLVRRIRRRLFSRLRLENSGTVVAHQTPGLLLLRQSSADSCDAGDVLVVRDGVHGARLAIVLDYVGRDTGILRRAVELGSTKPPDVLVSRARELEPGTVAKIAADPDVSSERLFVDRARLVGLVASESSLDRLMFEVVQNEGLEQGCLVETVVGGRWVTYQTLDGVTKEEVVHQKSTRGFCRAQAQKLGEWDGASKRFKRSKWVPTMNSPVFLRQTAEFAPDRNSVGHLPGTDYGVTLKDMDSLVTHNTAILGILGVGKTSLALELVERMLDAGIRVICVDMTNQYGVELASFRDAAADEASVAELQGIGAAGKHNVAQNVAEGGSIQEFGKKLRDHVEAFVASPTGAKLRVYNPSEFEVWRQDGKPYANKAAMAQLSSAEITQLLSEATLRASAKLGMTPKARVCLVYEEAHTLVPEWNSVAAEGDKTATNGTARAILQGRKYGLGCLLITQRTANVTKSILNQCHTVFAMRTFDDTGKEFLGNYLGREHAASLSSLEERHAVVFGKASSCENPVLVRLNDRSAFVEVFRASTCTPPP